MEELKEFRRINRLTQDQLGELLGMKKSFISKIENGREKFPLDKFRKLINNEWGFDLGPLKGLTEPPVRMSLIGLFNSDHSMMSEYHKYPDISFKSVPRTSSQAKISNLMDENRRLKEKIAELEKQKAELTKQRDEYWDMLKQLIFVVEK